MDVVFRRAIFVVHVATAMTDLVVFGKWCHFYSAHWKLQLFLFLFLFLLFILWDVFPIHDELLFPSMGFQTLGPPDCELPIEFVSHDTVYLTLGDDS
jgi:hypothetical protein